jgi:catechol-2,3-dioxygenase
MSPDVRLWHLRRALGEGKNYLMNHAHLGARDLAAARSFYETYFGFRKKFDHGSGVFLEDGKGFLLAIDPVESPPAFPDWYHLGFCMDDAVAVKSLYARMKQDGIAVAREIKAEEGEFASFYVLDPGGNKLEVSWHRE